VEEGDVVPVTGPSGEYLGDATIREVITGSLAEADPELFEFGPVGYTLDAAIEEMREHYGEQFSEHDEVTLVLFRFDPREYPQKERAALCIY